jgi:putative peptidoglycan lipid II flippase
VSSLPGEPAPVPGTDSPAGLARSSALLASGTFVSRILGFVSALVLAFTLGTQNAAANSFALANQLPNNIYAIIAGGLLSAVLVPQIVRAGLHSDGGQSFINRLVTLGVVVFLAVAVAATIAAPWLVQFYAGLGDKVTQAELGLGTAFAYWCLPQVLFYALYSLVGEVLNARRVFGPFTWAPVVNNVVAIAGLIAFAVMFGVSPAHDSAAAWTPPMITLLAGSATLGVACQAAILLVFWRRTGLGFRPDFRWRGVGLGTTGKAAAWVFGMVLINQLAGVVETNVAFLAGEGNPSVAVLRFAWLIFMLPHSIVTVSIGTAYFTRMSTHARDGRLAAVRDDVSSSLRAILLVIVFAAVGLAVLAYPFSALFAKNFDDVNGMATVVIAYLAGLIPFTVLFVLQRTFYSIEDTRTPFFVQVLQAALFTAGAVLVVASLPGEWIALGIAVVTTIAGSVQALVSFLILRRRIGGVGATRVLPAFGQYVLAAVPAGLAGYALLLLLGGFEAGGFAVATKPGAAASMVVVGTAMALVYGGMLALVRNPELLSFAAAVSARARRGR